MVPGSRSRGTNLPSSPLVASDSLLGPQAEFLKDGGDRARAGGHEDEETLASRDGLVKC